MSDIKKNLEIIIALFVVIGGIWGATEFFAKADDLKLVEFRLDKKIQSDRAADVQKRMWMLEEHYKDMNLPTVPQPVKEEYKCLKLELQEVKEKIKK